MKIITLKYPGKCRDCGRRLERGESAAWAGRGRVYCANSCTSEDDDFIERQIQRRNNAEYEKGKSEARQYLNDVATYGRELADEWERDAELARFNRGEDY